MSVVNTVTYLEKPLRTYSAERLIEVVPGPLHDLADHVSRQFFCHRPRICDLIPCDGSDKQFILFATAAPKKEGYFQHPDYLRFGPTKTEPGIYGIVVTEDELKMAATAPNLGPSPFSDSELWTATAF